MQLRAPDVLSMYTQGHAAIEPMSRRMAPQMVLETMLKVTEQMNYGAEIASAECVPVCVDACRCVHGSAKRRCNVLSRSPTIWPRHT